MVIGMSAIIRWLPVPLQHHSKTRAKISQARTADCLPWNDARIPPQRHSKGRTAQCMCTVKWGSYAFSHERNVKYKSPGFFLSSAPGRSRPERGSTLGGLREMLRGIHK